MKKLMIFALSITLMILTTSCKKQDYNQNDIMETDVSEITTQSNTSIEIQREEDMSLLTEEELITLCNLSENEYANKDLSSFINFYEFTEENVKLFNIHKLLENYVEHNNVERVFTSNAKKRESNFTDNAVCIVFMENKNTTVNSVYIDVDKNQKWAYMGRYIFHDLNSFDYKEISDGNINSLLLSLNELRVFSLDNLNYSDKSISDPMSYTFIVNYADGTQFKVSRTGQPSKICPDNYEEWRRLLIS